MEFLKAILKEARLPQEHSYKTFHHQKTFIFSLG